MAWFAGIEFRRKLAQHRDIVTGFDRGLCDECMTADFVKGIFELGKPVGGIDVDKDQARIRCRELDNHPFTAICGKQADAVAGFETERDKCRGQPLCFVL